MIAHMHMCLYICVCVFVQCVSLYGHIFAHTCRGARVMIAAFFRCPPPKLMRDPLIKFKFG